MAGKIPQSFIDQLLMRVDIVAVIDRRVPLTQKGREYLACCPFHDEKTPSFTVSPTKQFYHCFGCGAHGTAIGFLMDYANLGFIEAVEELASSVGLPLPERTGGGSSPTPQPLLDIVAHASQWFQTQLRSHATATHAVEYLKSRGLDGETAKRFQIGYAPDGWDNLVTALGKTEAQRKHLVTAGLAKRPENANPHASLTDRFRARIIFPIQDHRGRIVGFGGRSLGDGVPKYLNSPETPLFHKGEELYNLHQARREIGACEHSIVVEGYMDVVALAQFGVNNAVATLGTATTRTHIQRLFRLSQEIVFCFDGDRAGRAAAWKAMQSALPEMRDGRQLSFLFLPDGEDPDTIIRQEKREGFQKRVREAKPLEGFLFDTLTEQVDMGRVDGRARLFSMAVPLIEQIPLGALREMLRTHLKEQCNLPEEYIQKVAASTKTKQVAPPQARRSSHPTSLPAKAIQLLLHSPHLAEKINDPTRLDELTIKGVDVLRDLLGRLRATPDLTTARILESYREDANIHPHLEKLATRPPLITGEDAQARELNEILDKLCHQDRKNQRDSIAAQIKNTPPEAKQQALQRARQLQGVLQPQTPSAATPDAK